MKNKESLIKFHPNKSSRIFFEFFFILVISKLCIHSVNTAEKIHFINIENFIVLIIFFH